MGRQRRAHSHCVLRSMDSGVCFFIIIQHSRNHRGHDNMFNHS
jgi:hypothetical protein